MENQMQETVETPIQENKKNTGFTGSTIKIIAIVTMLIDHIGAVVLERLLTVQAQTYGYYDAYLYYTDLTLRGIGRLGFPIFCFLLVEGFQKTKNLSKYFMRLVIFAFLSEIPFNLAINGSLFDLYHQNVFFTLLLGMIALCEMHNIQEVSAEKEKLWMKVLGIVGGLAAAGVYIGIVVNNLAQYAFWGYTTDVLIKQGIKSLAGIAILIIVLALNTKGIWKMLGQVGVVSILMLIADNLCTDYGGMGVVAIAIMYAVRENKVLSYFTGTLSLCISNYYEIPAMLALYAIQKYNGERGLKLKYFFYAFYPVHLFILWLIALALGMGSVSVG